jgi:site-specific DNA-adenine methylase
MSSVTKSTPAKPVFAYVGGKTKAIPKLDSILTIYFPDAVRLYSPFLGGAAFEVHCLNQHGMTVYGNDLMRPLISLWTALRDQRPKLRAALARSGKLSREEYHARCAMIKRWTADPPLATPQQVLREATVYFTVQNASFSSILGHYSKERSTRRILADPDRLDRAGPLTKLKLSCGDALAFIRRHRSAGQSSRSVLYVDPPYALVHNDLYGVGGSLHRGFDHQALHDLLVKRKNWILSYNDVPYIRKLYRGYRIVSTTWTYTMQRSTTKHIAKGKEIIIISRA